MGIKKYLKKFARFILANQPDNFVEVKVSQINYGEILKDKNIVITGGGRGLGFYMAKKCLLEGANVCISGRDENTLKEACKELGGKISYVVYDISNIEKCDDFLDKCEEKFKAPVWTLINNAGISLHEGNFTNVTPEGFDKQINVNLKGTYFLSKTFLERKIKQKSLEGNLIIISSLTGEQCCDIPYGLTKAALNSLVGALSRRVYKNGIRVNAVAPGVTRSDMTNYAELEGGNLARDCASGRVFLPEEIAETIVFLLSDASKCITGEVIHCDAGEHLRVQWKD